MVDDTNNNGINQCGRVNFHHLYICSIAHPSIPSFVHCCAAPLPLSLCYPTQPALHPFNPPSVCPALTPTNFRHRHSFSQAVTSILFACLNHFNTICSTLPANFLSIPALQRTYSFLNLSIHVTPTVLIKHFISRTLTILPAALLVSMSLRHKMRAKLLIHTLSRAYTRGTFCSSPLLTHCTPHSFCVPHAFFILHPLPLATIMHLKLST